MHGKIEFNASKQGQIDGIKSETKTESKEEREEFEEILTKIGAKTLSVPSFR